MSWLAFAGMFGAFLLTHTVPVRPKVKARLVGFLGSSGFTIAYSILSICMLALLISAAADAPYLLLWDQEIWQRSVTSVGMLGVCLLLALAIGRPNPFSFGGIRNERFDPAHSGPVRFSRHPILLVLALWAGLHVLPNGDLAHVILFGSFAGFALIGMRIIDRRKRSEMGAAWGRLKERVEKSPLLPMPVSISGFVFRALLGIFIYAVLLGVHPFLFGVSPLP